MPQAIQPSLLCPDAGKKTKQNSTPLTLLTHGTPPAPRFDTLYHAETPPHTSTPIQAHPSRLHFTVYTAVSQRTHQTASHPQLAHLRAIPTQHGARPVVPPVTRKSLAVLPHHKNVSFITGKREHIENLRETSHVPQSQNSPPAPPPARRSPPAAPARNQSPARSSA